MCLVFRSTAQKKKNTELKFPLPVTCLLYVQGVVTVLLTHVGVSWCLLVEPEWSSLSALSLDEL